MRRRETRGFATAAALAYGFAGLVFPLVGWFVGITLVWIATRWTVRQKLVAAIVPTALMMLTAAAVFVTYLFRDAVIALPSAYDVAWFGLSVVAVMTTSLGLWLLHATRD